MPAIVFGMCWWSLFRLVFVACMFCFGSLEGVTGLRMQLRSAWRYVCSFLWLKGRLSSVVGGGLVSVLALWVIWLCLLHMSKIRIARVWRLRGLTWCVSSGLQAVSTLQADWLQLVFGRCSAPVLGKWFLLVFSLYLSRIFSVFGELLTCTSEFLIRLLSLGTYRIKHSLMWLQAGGWSHLGLPAVCLVWICIWVSSTSSIVPC